MERAIGSVMMVIKKLLHGSDVDWPLFVPLAQYSFNARISFFTGSMPFSLMFGRSPAEWKDYSASASASVSDVPVSVSLDDWKLQQEKLVSLIYPAVSNRIRESKSAMMKRLDAHRRLLLPTSIPAGSTVMLKDVTRSNKFEPKYVGPYIVLRRSRGGAYVLRDLTGDVLDRRVPGDQLKLVSKKARAKDKDPKAVVYVVNKVIDHRGSPGAYEYLVNWSGYSDSDNTWEPATSFLDDAVIKRYWTARKK